jgi:hypothetical protein
MRSCAASKFRVRRAVVRDAVASTVRDAVASTVRDAVASTERDAVASTGASALLGSAVRGVPRALDWIV